MASGLGRVPLPILSKEEEELQKRYRPTRPCRHCRQTEWAGAEWLMEHVRPGRPLEFFHLPCGFYVYVEPEAN
jgi:hypothetical protein